jgi:hypothetical protein
MRPRPPAVPRLPTIDRRRPDTQLTNSTFLFVP